MNKVLSRLAVLLTVASLTGCTGLLQFPDTSKDYTKALTALDPNYDAALKEFYASADVEARKGVRNKLIETRMAVIDEHFRGFVAGLAKENAGVDFGVALVGVGVGGAGALVTESASQILSAVSGGLAGAHSAYDKTIFYDQALSAMVAQMHASRAEIAAQIFQKWGRDTNAYPLWVARRDLEAYQFAGSLPGAIGATSADANVKQEEANAILLGAVTSEAVTQEVLDGAAKNIQDLANLTDEQAIGLVLILENIFPKDVPVFGRALDPAGVRFKNGTDAKTFMKAVTPRINRTKDDVEKLRKAIETAKQS